jgi:hypothetical protein
MQMLAQEDFVAFGQHENIGFGIVMQLATSQLGTSREAYKELIRIKKTSINSVNVKEHIG